MILPTDKIWMQHALNLAKQGQYTVRPNPLVGAVVVKDEKMISQGWHQKAGGPHAEVHALQQLQTNCQGATLYVTLEPCCHYGKTPPCVELIKKHNIKRVVVATLDPNPLVKGQGCQLLKDAGIEVDIGVLAEAALAQNAGFMSTHTRHQPFVSAKMAMSVDGKIAMQNGESQWITSEAARAAVHAWRARHGAIITSWQTVNSDDCLMSVRSQSVFQALPATIEFEQPMRLIVDSQLRCSTQAQIFQPSDQAVIVAVGAQVTKAQQDKWLQQIKAENVSVVRFPGCSKNSNHLDVCAILQYLNEMNIHDAWVEAGAGLLTNLLEQNVIDRLILHVAPDLLGHHTLPMQQLNISSLDKKKIGEFEKVVPLGRDLELSILISDYAKKVLKGS